MTTYSEIENLGSSLVREYLSRKGLKNTLSAMDKELPRDSCSISNRLVLAQSMHMEKLMKKNKEHPKPLRTMIEIMVKYFLEKAGFPFREERKEASVADADKVPQRHNVESTWMEKDAKKSAPSTPRPKSAFKEPSEPPRSTSKPPAKVGRDAKDVAIEDESGGEQMAARGYGATFKCLPKRPSDDDGMIHRTLFADETLPSPEPRRFRGVSPEDPKFRVKPGASLLPPDAVASSAEAGAGIGAPSPSPTSRSQPRKPIRVGRNGSSNANINISAVEENDTSNNSCEVLDADDGESTAGANKTDGEKEMKKTKIEKEKSRSSLGAANRPTMGGRPTSSRPIPTARPFAPAPSSASSSSKSDAILPTSTSNANSNNHSNLLSSPTSSSPTLSTGKANSPKPSSASSSRSSSAASDKIERSSTVSHESRLKPAVDDVGELEDIEDIEDEDDGVDIAALTPALPSKLLSTSKNVKPIDEDVARSLKLLIFGTSTTSASSFNEEWMRQGFAFCRRPALEYGVVQRKGGPCGVLAAVQAAMLKEMLFNEDQRWKTGKKGLSAVSLNASLRASALARALARILWRAGEERSAVVATPSGRSYFHHAANYAPDKFTETLNVNSFENLESLQQFLDALCESQLTDEQFPAVVVILYSAIISRGVDKIRADFDDPTSRLMGAHSYCTQEMVNLLLSGAAVSNVHNNVIYLGDPDKDEDCVKLKGLTKQNHIGFLSLFEHYGNFEVGTFYKTPLVPIWVVCSESHFSVLFCLNRELVTNWKAERRFELYYYDGLANQEEEICLTIDTTDPDFKPPDEELEMVPPLEHVVRTKWKDARVDWNGTEPLL